MLTLPDGVEIRWIERQGEVVIIHFDDDPATGRAYGPAQAFLDAFGEQHGLRKVAFTEWTSLPAGVNG